MLHLAFDMIKSYTTNERNNYCKIKLGVPQGCGAGAQAILDGRSRSQKILNGGTGA